MPKITDFRFKSLIFGFGEFHNHIIASIYLKFHNTATAKAFWTTYPNTHPTTRIITPTTHSPPTGISFMKYCLLDSNCPTLPNSHTQKDIKIEIKPTKTSHCLLN